MSKSKKEVEVEVVEEGGRGARRAPYESEECATSVRGVPSRPAQPTTALAVAEAEICKWMQGGKCGNAEGPKGFDCIGLRSCRFGRSNKAQEMPTTIQVRRHKHLVNLPVEQAITQQYDRVQKISAAAGREMFVFGLMLERINQALTDSRHNPDGSGVSLKSWLAEKCPTIKYRTALDYRTVTRNVIDALKVKKDAPLLQMMYTDGCEDPADEIVRKKIIAAIANKTMNQLRDEYKQKPGNTQATGRKELTAVERAARAASDANELVGSLHAFVFSGTSLSLLTEAELSSFAHELKVCASRVEEEIRKK